MYFDAHATGKRIQQLRKAKGMTQEELAIKLNISDRHLRNLERGEEAPSIDLLVEIMESFNTTLDYLIVGKTPSEKEELMNKKKQSINYLDLIPQRAETLRWHTDEATGLITPEVENTGVFNTIAQKVFHKPRTTQVHLDETGSYLWPLIDGRKTVAQLADCMKQQFGEKAEPLYPRIIKYFQIVESYHFIKFLNQ